MKYNNKFNFSFIKKLSKILNDMNLTEIEYKINKKSIRIVKAIQNTNLKELINQKKKKKHIILTENIIKSPMAGIVYTSINPEEKPLIKIGDIVKKGQIILIIETMKIMNYFRSPKNGTIKHILIKNEENIDFNQPLFILK